MRCSDCNGVIEGKPPLCPHCGRKFGGLLNKPAPARKRPRGPITASRRIKLEKTIENPAPSPIATSLGRFIILAIVGAMIGASFPGNRWVLGAIIGLFIALQTRKKN